MAAETILIPVAKQVLSKASDLALEQIGLLRSFKPELRKLKDTVSTIQAVLHDAQEKQFHNRQVKDWLEKLSDVMYDADDILDDLATEARRKAVLAAATDEDDGGRGTTKTTTTTTTTCWSLVCFLFSSLPKELLYELEMARAIKAIREKLDAISKDKETLHLEVHSTTKAEAFLSRETDSCPPTIVVGREDDKQNIIKLLLSSNHEATISVVTIVGMGGLGKTTLAQLVFDDDQVNDHFDIKVWVYVSQRFDVKVILRKMLRSIDCRIEADSELDDLQAKFREKIKGRRFLFVLDDVWEESNPSWETLGKYLTKGEPGSKVLVTTRSTKVAEVSGGALRSETCTSIVEPYHLKGLSEEESWNLLVKKALPREVLRDPQVQEIGKQILGKCDGVPLAVSAIASVLADSRDPKTEWSTFLQKGLSSIMKGQEDPIMSVLQLSFNHLPSYMKNCFTFCKLFPKGFEFDIKMLVQFWVIHKYIETEDEGFDCFKTLWGRSFFQEVVMDDLGNMLKCRMHDLMHDLVDSMGGEKIMRSSASTCLGNISSTTCHLAITGDSNDDSREDYYGGHEPGNPCKVRTLICLKNLSNKELKQIFRNFLRLRVLVIIEGSNSECNASSLDASLILNSVHKLKHLRYLGLGGAGGEKIPNSVATLVNMQVLKLVDFWRLKELPRDIKTLVNLKHLELDSEYVVLNHVPKGIGELKFLQTLSTFVVGKRVGAGLDELKGLNALSGKLTIEGLAYADTPREGVYVLKEKLYLQSLVLDWGRDCDRDVDGVTLLSTRDEGMLEMLWPHPNLKSLMIRGGGVYQGAKLPNWLSGLTSLVEFSLIDCKRIDYLPQLHQMFSLIKLTIQSCPLLKGISRDGDGYQGATSGLANLVEFSLIDCKRCEYLPQLHQMSSLKKLTIKQCPILKDISHDGGSGVYQSAKLPNWLSGLANLVEFSLIDCKRCEYMPRLHQMSSLKKLTIQNCPLLKGISHDGYHGDNNSMENSATKEEDDNWPQFHCLSSLCIKGCPMLTRLPTFPTLEGELQLDNVSLAPFARTMKMKMKMRRGGVDYLEGYSYNDTNIHPLLPPPSASSSSSSSSALIHPLSKLIKLALSDMDDDLESLSHHDFKNCLLSIQNLTIEQCGRGVKLPGSLCSSIHLIDIFICGCKMIEYLPPLHELPSLKMLTIADCPNLKECWWKKQQGNNNESSYHDYYNFDSSMEEEEVVKEGEEAAAEEWPHFPHLSYLTIRYCPKLTRIPLFPTLEGGLLLEQTSGQALVRTMKMKAVVVAAVPHHVDSQQHSATTATTTTSPSSSSSRTALVAPLSKLKEMIISGIDDLESLPEEGICNLTSLQEFVIWECPRLASLPPAMRYLTSLPSLRINDCEKLTERCKEEDWPNISHIPYILLNYKELQNLAACTEGKR
ncbi:unnamed protein product [Linum trigynum]|uniref:Uncharacterized protein n=1 Tax=Linum trigynum TaxID=586398 RepID=A0AAV2E2L7_9ROSI